MTDLGVAVAQQTGPLGPYLPAWVPEHPAVALGLGLVVVLLGWYLSRLTVQLVARPMARRFGRPSVTRTMLRSVRAVVLGVTALIALWVSGVELGNIALSVGVFSAMLGIILAPIVGSVISGLFILADQPYEIGDMIELGSDGRQGFVEDITLRYTKMFTLDNTFLVIPNGTMRERDVVNYSAEDERTRLSLGLLVTYEGDLEAARELMERAARDVDRVISGGPDIRIGSARYPAAPTCYIDEYADSGVKLTMRYWVKEPYRLLTVRSAVNERVWSALEAAEDVDIAYPHTHLVVDETSGLPTDALDRDRPGASGPPGA